MSAPIKAVCSKQYTAVHYSGTRTLTDIRWVVLHCTEGATAQGAAAWFANPASQGSAHLVVDDLICYRTLSNLQVPWGAQGANKNGFHIEMAGFARWTTEQWLAHDKTLRRAAFKTALHAKLFGIPLRWVGPKGLMVRKKGITTHADCTKAFGGSHTDPGPNFPKSVFMGYVRLYDAELSV
jgi:N-acetyl-anhydromuramyl-L-alanine amidase AmpD